MRITIPRSYAVRPVGTGSSIGRSGTGRLTPAYSRRILRVSGPLVIELGFKRSWVADFRFGEKPFRAGFLCVW